MTEQFLTVEQAAKRLQISPYSLREWLKSGQLHGVKIGAKWRVPTSSLDALAEPKPQTTREQTTSESVVPDKWQQDAARLSDVYARSVADGDDLTAFTTATGDFYETTGDAPQ